MNNVNGETTDLNVGQPCWDKQVGNFVKIVGHSISNVYVVRSPGVLGNVYESPRHKLVPVPDWAMSRTVLGSRADAPDPVLAMVAEMLHQEPDRIEATNPLADLINALTPGTILTIQTPCENGTEDESCDEPC